MINVDMLDTNNKLVKISQKIVEDIKAGLFVGRGNVWPDIAKTSGWSSQLVINCRSDRKWKKK